MNCFGIMYYCRQVYHLKKLMLKLELIPKITNLFQCLIYLSRCRPCDTKNKTKILLILRHNLAMVKYDQIMEP